MLGNIAKGYKKLLSAIGAVIALAAGSAVLGAVIVLPLWKWATRFPRPYSAAVICAALVLVVLAVARSAKKLGAAVFLRKALKVLCVAAGVSLCLVFLYRGNRPAALVTVPVAVLAYGMTAFGFSKA